MRILFAVPSYWPSQDGVANITGYLAQGLAKRGHEVRIITSSGNGGLQELPKEESYEGVFIERMRIYVQWPAKLKGRDLESTKEAYRKRIMTYQPDVLIVVCSQTWTLDWLISCLDRIECPKIFYSHGYSKWMDKYPYREKLKKRNVVGAWHLYLCKRYYDKLYRVIAKFERAIYLSDTNNAFQYAKKHGLENGIVLENAIDDAFYEEKMQHVYSAKSEDATGTSEISYLFVANFNENKNHEMLIRAYANAKIGKSRLVFAAFEENEYSEYLRKLTTALFQTQSEKKVFFYVHLPREEIIDLYRTCDVFVCPSKSEQYPIVAHEAAATAMPIISTDVGMYREISGVKIVHGQQEMKEALELFYYHPSEREKSGMAAKAWFAGRHCRISDKIDRMEQELLFLTGGSCDI